MNNKSGAAAGTAAAAVIAAVISCAGCSSKKDDYAQSAAVKPGNVALSAAQRRNVRLYTVQASKFHKTVETTGVVDFDNDQATSVIAPFSGPVARLLVSPGERVRKDQPLATVTSPDFAAAVSAYRKAIAAADTARKLADMDKDLLAHKGVSEREAQQAESDAVSAEAIKATLRRRYPDLSHVTVEVAVCADCT